jgi:hypothetical protein
MYATSESTYAANGTMLEEVTLSVIDVETMKKEPSKALLFSFNGGCNPVMSLISSEGKTVWVSARASNHLLAFDAAKLKSSESGALVASVQVGTSPIGLTSRRTRHVFLLWVRIALTTPIPWQDCQPWM